MHQGGSFAPPNFKVVNCEKESVRLGTVAHICNPMICEAKAGGS